MNGEHPASGGHPAREQVPVPFLIGAGALVLATLALIGASRLTGIGYSALPETGIVAERALRFEDRPDGAIAVHAEPDGALVATVAAGGNGFLRGTLRALARERRQSGIGARAPFRLSLTADGSLWLQDTATARRIDLGAFGADNARVFAALLPSGRTPQ
jgi:putative photosynthetic complex assembly protein